MYDEGVAQLATAIIKYYESVKLENLQDEKAEAHRSVMNKVIHTLVVLTIATFTQFVSCSEHTLLVLRTQKYHNHKYYILFFTFYPPHRMV